MKRSKFSLSRYGLLTCDMGELVPVNLIEVLPGDSIQQFTSALLRVSPVLAPVMHPISVRFHHWYVPTRTLWSGWEDFITGGQDGVGGSSGTYPTIDPGGSGFAAGALADYLGVPPGVADLEVCALPFRAYNKIYNEFYRDQDLVSEVSEDSVAVQKVAWEKDYFTAARPWLTRGNDVTLPTGTTAPVYSLGATTGSQVDNDGSASVQLHQVGGTVGNSGIYADLSAATAININDFREAFALQRYQEARARYGARFTEYLRYLGIRSSDARLQRPQYLGGGKSTISFSEVLQTGVDSTDAGVGTLRGHGIAAMRTRRYRRFFEEHGYVMTLMSVRPKTLYTESLHRMWNRATKEDYWQKELESIGQQEVYRREVYAQSDANGGDTVFGYQDCYDEYRRAQSTVHADFRSTLDHWHLARQLGAAPTLNESFITCSPSKRIHAEQSNDSLWVMVNNSVQARRLVKKVGTSHVY